MCVDGKTGMIYLMGHFRPCDNSEHDDEEPNDLWAYHTRGEKQGQFELLDADARRNGGPKLVHDLQMVVDEEGGGIWVFGGRHSNQPDLEADQSWSGLYRYNIQKRTWTLLRCVLSHITLYSPIVLFFGWPAYSDMCIRVGLQE